MIGVVIPTLNEGRSLGPLLEDLRQLRTAVSLDIVVVDGGSTDETWATAMVPGVRILAAPRGRARQLNAGARAARGEWLLFLHADVRLANEAQRTLVTTVEPASGVGAAVFRFAIDLPWFWKHFIELGQRMREALWGLPYGDQGLLVRRELFESVGGYPEIPLMEDVAIIRRLRHRTVMRQLPARLVTSGRRYLREGIVRTWLRHTALITLYSMGVSPYHLGRWRNA